MSETHVPRSRWKIVLSVAAIAIVVVIALGVLVGVKGLLGKHGDKTGSGANSWLAALKDLGEVATDPRAGFPGKSRINILCMGIDENWTNSDLMYTGKARTDTLFMLSLDMDNKKANILSIPRDAYVPIAGKDYSTKINAAYSIGGPKAAEETVAQVLGGAPDYYLVIKIDGTKKIVDALGGVDLNVEHELDYDDNWGHLHVHLKPGQQHLTGDEAVGFARYRHSNHGVVTPEDGDVRRMYRQHVLVRAMVDKMKSIGSLLKPNYLIDTAVSCIETDLSRTQLFELGAIFHGIDQDQIITAQTPFLDSKSAHGASVVDLDTEKAVLLGQWLLQGNDAAGRQVTPVYVKNSTKVNGLAAGVVDQVKSWGYADAKVGVYDKPYSQKTTTIVDNGVPNHAAAKELAGYLQLPDASIVHETINPNKFGWAPQPSLTILLGDDMGAKSSPNVGASSSSTSGM
jgi:LCP family protein required for cell wall assembly